MSARAGVTLPRTVPAKDFDGRLRPWPLVSAVSLPCSVRDTQGGREDRGTSGDSVARPSSECRQPAGVGV